MRRGGRVPRNDVLLAAGVTALAVLEGLTVHHARVAAVTCFSAMAVSLVWRRVLPWAPAVLVAALLPTMVVAGVSLNAGVNVVVVVAVGSYSAAAYQDLRWAVPTMAVLAVGGVGSVLLDNRPVASNLAFVALLIGVPWGAGVAMRARQRYVAVLEEQTTLLEQDREVRARLAVADERARIARELHDIVSHSLSVISLQAGGVRRLLEPGQEKEREALLAVERAARGAIEEMHHMLGLLRSEPEAAGLAPQPGLADLASLVAGAPVAATLSTEGAARPLPPGIELAVYRAVQEALTNVAKHSDATSTKVVLRYGPAGLQVSVTDNGSPVAGSGAGLGLRGMRERIALYGGTVEAGPFPGGGWRVDATLPFPREPA